MGKNLKVESPSPGQAGRGRKSRALLLSVVLWAVKSVLLWAAAFALIIFLVKYFDVAWPIASLLAFSIFGVSMLALPVAFAAARISQPRPRRSAARAASTAVSNH